MQRRVKEPYGHRQSLHLGKYPDKVPLLHRQYLCERLFPPGSVVGKDHLTDRLYPIALKEHMLCPHQSYAFCTELSCQTGVSRCIGIRPHPYPPEFIAPLHYRAEVPGKLGLCERNLTKDHLTGGPVERDMNSPSLTIWLSTTKCFRSSPIFIVPQPATQHFPIPLATTAA